MKASDYTVIATQCRILSKDPTTPAMTASVLIAAAKAVESQAERCVSLASHLEKQEAVIYGTALKRKSRAPKHEDQGRNLWQRRRTRGKT